jgi:hypothetical protein
VVNNCGLWRSNAGTQVSKVWRHRVTGASLIGGRFAMIKNKVELVRQ